MRTDWQRVLVIELALLAGCTVEPPLRRGWCIDAWRASRAASRTPSVAADGARAGDLLP